MYFIGTLCFLISLTSINGIPPKSADTKVAAEVPPATVLSEKTQNVVGKVAVEPTPTQINSRQLTDIVQKQTVESNSDKLNSKSLTDNVQKPSADLIPDKNNSKLIADNVQKPNSEANTEKIGNRLLSSENIQKPVAEIATDKFGNKLPENLQKVEKESIEPVKKSDKLEKVAISEKKSGNETEIPDVPSDKVDTKTDELNSEANLAAAKVLNEEMPRRLGARVLDKNVKSDEKIVSPAAPLKDEDEPAPAGASKLPIAPKPLYKIII